MFIEKYFHVFVIILTKNKFYYPNQYNSELLNFLTEEKRFKKFVATQRIILIII